MAAVKGQAKRHPTCVLVDAGLAPLVSKLDVWSEFRLWLVAHEINRLSKGSGKIATDALLQTLTSWGIAYSLKHFNRILDAGTDTFWTFDGQKKHLYLKSFVGLWKVLGIKVGWDLNNYRPAQTFSLVDVADSSGAGKRRDGSFKARMYAAWIATQNKYGQMTISRQRLSDLWGVHTNTLIGWERNTGIEKTENYAQLAGGDSHLQVPKHARAYAAKTSNPNEVEIHLCYQIPNTYRANAVEYRYAGQLKKARKARKALLLSLSEQPAEQCGGGSPDFGKLYFEGDKAFKSANHHLRKHGDLERAHYAHIGVSKGRKMWERISTKTHTQRTTADERCNRWELPEDVNKRIDAINEAIREGWTQNVDSLCGTAVTLCRTALPPAVPAVPVEPAPLQTVTVPPPNESAHATPSPKTKSRTLPNAGTAIVYQNDLVASIRSKLKRLSGKIAIAQAEEFESRLIQVRKDPTNLVALHQEVLILWEKLEARKQSSYHNSSYSTSNR